MSDLMDWIVDVILLTIVIMVVLLFLFIFTCVMTVVYFPIPRKELREGSVLVYDSEKYVVVDKGSNYIKLVNMRYNTYVILNHTLNRKNIKCVGYMPKWLRKIQID